MGKCRKCRKWGKGEIEKWGIAVTFHAIAGKGMKTYPLDGVGSKLSAADIKSWILTPATMEAKQAVKAKMKMKAFKLEGADLDNLVAYLGSLKK